MFLSNGVTKGKEIESTAKNYRAKHCILIFNSIAVPSVRNKYQS